MLKEGVFTPGSGQALRAALTALPSHDRDAWVDARLGLEAFVPDEPALPRGCTPYYPCSVNVILQAVELARIKSEDVFVDVGSGIGRATTLVHLLTGAETIGIEIQPGLVERARRLADDWGLSRCLTLEGDAEESLRLVPYGSVFFLYCPFSGARLERALDQLEDVAKRQPIRICGVQLPTIRRAWLELASPETDELVLYRSVVT